MTIIDTPCNTTAVIPRLLQHGVTHVVRYYCFRDSPGLPEKRLKLPEAQALSRNGIQIGVVFQQRQDRVGDFSEATGLAAGRHAYRYARDEIHQPSRTVISFAVDCDPSKAEIKSNIIPYFKGVRRAFEEERGDGGPEYRVGAYGSGLVCKTLRQEGLISFTWLSMSVGFRGTREALAAGEYQLAQKYPCTTLCGIDVDFDDWNPDHPDLGTFTVEPGASEDEVVTGRRYKVTARSGLRLRRGPGTNFDIIGGLDLGQVVTVAGEPGDWARVDVDGDGKVDGYASAAYLKCL